MYDPLRDPRTRGSCIIYPEGPRTTTEQTQQQVPVIWDMAHVIKRNHFGPTFSQVPRYVVK